MAVKNLAEKPVTKLTEMKVREISLVDDPASPGADVILLKRKVDDLVAEAIEVLKRGYNPDEPRDKSGRWVHEAVNLLRRGASRTGAAFHPAGQHAVDLLREGAQYLQHTLPSDLAAGVRAAARTLHSQAREAANAVVDHVSAGIGVGVSALKTIRMSGVHPVHGGGVQFSFEHGLGNFGHLKTHVQIRPEHFEEGSAKARALRTLHRYLISRDNEGDGGVKVPFSADDLGDGKKDAVNWFRFSHSPTSLSSNSSNSSQSVTRPPITPSNASNSSLLNPESGRSYEPNPITQFHPQARVEEYLWHRRQEPTWSRDARTTYQGPNEGSPTTSRGNSYTAKATGHWIPATRPDVQHHIERVHRQIAGHPNGASEKKTMERENPHFSGGHGFFTPQGDYVPAGPTEVQWDFMRQYNNHRQGQAVARSVLQPAAAPTIENGRYAETNPDVTALTPSEAEVIGDHISNVTDRNSGRVPDELRDLMDRSEKAAQENSELPLNQDEVNTLWRSLNQHRDLEGETGGNARRHLRQKLEGLPVQKRVQKIIRAKINI